MALLNGQQGAFVALNRFGFGARQGDLALLANDPVNALREEITKKRVVIPQGPDFVSSIVAIQENDEFKTARRLAKEKSEKDSEAKMMADPAMQNGPMQGGSMPPGTNMQANAAPPQGPKPPPKPEGPQQRYFRVEMMARFQAAIDAPVGFGERLVWFWSNHFCISSKKGGATAACPGQYEREVIRPHVFGKFADMLLAAEKHPAMLNYLDNRQSIGPNSKAGTRRDKGLNENLAREILELHTLGANGGYSQTDVTNLAKILTGWTIVSRNEDDGEMGDFVFNPNRHEPGPQALLGKNIPAGGVEQGEMALNQIARHPSTARHIALKLAKHFVADDPPASLVQKLAKVFQDTDGDLTKVSLALVEAKEAWSPDLVKMRNPQEFVVAALRATGAKYDLGQINGPLRAMGHFPWQPEGPNGYADTVANWASPDGMKTRLDYVSNLAKRVPEGRNPNELLDLIIGEAASKDTRQSVMRAESRQQGIAILLMSPEFQRR